LHQVGVSFDLYYDARKHKIKIYVRTISFLAEYRTRDLPTCANCCAVLAYVCEKGDVRWNCAFCRGFCPISRISCLHELLTIRLSSMTLQDGPKRAAMKADHVTVD